MARRASINIVELMGVVSYSVSVYETNPTDPWHEMHLQSYATTSPALEDGPVPQWLRDAFVGLIESQP